MFVVCTRFIDTKFFFGAIGIKIFRDVLQLERVPESKLGRKNNFLGKIINSGMMYMLELQVCEFW